MKKWVSAVAGLASLSALLAAGGLSAAAGASYAPYHSKPTYGGTFRIAFQTDIPELDPLTWTDLQSFYPMHAIYDTLVKYNDNSTQIVPDVAKTWTISKNGLVYTFYLRHNIRFSNGDPLTAQDVAYSIERLTSHANASVSGYGSYYKMIQGFQAWNSGKASTLTGVQVVNPYEIRFTLSYPAAYFLNDLALMAAAIVDPKVVQQWGNQNYSQHAVGSGPFMLKEWKRNQEMILVRNPLYWGPKPYLKQIDILIGPTPDLQLEMFQRGQLDETTEITSSNYLNIISNPQLRQYYHRTPMNGMYFVYLNTKEGPTKNVLVRQAMNYAIDKPLLIRTLTNGRGIPINDALMPPEMPGYDNHLPDLYPYNLQKARALMKEAHYAHGFSITFVGWTDPTTTALADFLQSELAKIHIKVNIRTMTYPQYLGVVSNPNKFGMAEYAWYQDYPDPQDFFDALAAQGAFGATNFSYYVNPKLQSLITEADQLPASQDARRWALYREAQTILAKQAPYLWEYYAWNDELVQPWVGPDNVNAWGLGPIYAIEFNRVWIAKH